MKSTTRQKTLYVCYAAIIAACYVILTYLSRLFGLDSGVIQLRLSEMLCVLPMFTTAAIPGVTVGCFLANLLTAAAPLDIFLGPVATLIGAVGTYALRKFRWLAPMPPIVSNALIIPFVLAYGYNVTEAIPFMMLTVGAGEILSIYGVGSLFYIAVKKNKDRIFKI